MYLSLFFFLIYALYLLFSSTIRLYANYKNQWNYGTNVLCKYQFVHIYKFTYIYLLNACLLLTLREMRGVVVDIGEANVYCGGAC